MPFGSKGVLDYGQRRHIGKGQIIIFIEETEMIEKRLVDMSRLSGRPRTNTKWLLVPHNEALPAEHICLLATRNRHWVSIKHSTGLASITRTLP